MNARFRKAHGGHNPKILDMGRKRLLRSCCSRRMPSGYRAKLLQCSIRWSTPSSVDRHSHAGVRNPWILCSKWFCMGDIKTHWMKHIAVCTWQGGTSWKIKIPVDIVNRVLEDKPKIRYLTSYTSSDDIHNSRIGLEELPLAAVACMTASIKKHKLGHVWF